MSGKKAFAAHRLEGTPGHLHRFRPHTGCALIRNEPASGAHRSTPQPRAGHRRQMLLLGGVGGVRAEQEQRRSVRGHGLEQADSMSGQKHHFQSRSLIGIEWD